MNPLKQRLLNGEFVTAAWAELGNPDVAEIMVRHGWPTILIDGEHGVGDLETWVAVARAVEAAGGDVILRVPDGQDTTLKRVLDRGFRSLVVPMVNSAEQAAAIARSCLYPGRGGSGQGGRGYAASIVRASHFGARPGYARELAHEDLLLFVQCEHPDSIASLEAIAATPGVDGIFLGPNDLSATLGHLEDMTHPVPQAAFAEVEAICAKVGTLLATVPGGGRGWADLRERGYHMVAGVNDVSLLAGAARQALAERDAALGKS